MSSEINLAWTNPSGSLTDNYAYVYAGSSCSGSPIVSYNLGVVTTTATIPGLTGGTIYSFTVTASTAGGEGPPSSCATATIFELPGAPTNLDVAASFDSAVLTWANPVSPLQNDTLAYGTTYGTYPTAVSEGVVQTATVTGLAPNTTYYFVVWAWSTGGAGPLSNVAVAHTLPLMNVTRTIWRNTTVWHNTTTWNNATVYHNSTVYVNGSSYWHNTTTWVNTTVGGTPVPPFPWGWVTAETLLIAIVACAITYSLSKRHELEDTD